MVKTKTLKRERLVNFRINSAQYDAIQRLAKRKKMTVTDYIKNAITATQEDGFTMELERNRLYHRQVLEALDEIERKMKRKQRSPARARSGRT